MAKTVVFANKVEQSRTIYNVNIQLVILEMVDYNIHRENDEKLYGFADYFCQHYT